MKYKYIITPLLAMTVITLIAQNMSPFLKATQSGWYPKFLNPVVDTITSNSEYRKILDIGTGPGTLPQILIKKDSSLQIVGIDIDSVMIDEARRRFTHKNVSFQYEKVNEKLEFKNEEFDVVTFCSVLFLLDDSTKSFLIYEALRVLKPEGKIIVLTPSGKKSRFTSFSEIWSFPYSKYNWTYFVWKKLTSSGGKKWQKEKWLENFAQKEQLKYTSILTFNDNARLEIISK